MNTQLQGRCGRLAPLHLRIAVAHEERTVPVFCGDLVATNRKDDLELDHVDVWRLERPAPRPGMP